jgi:O-phosphoseryl-tRNA(Cys) synthetase
LPKEKLKKTPKKYKEGEITQSEFSDKAKDKLKNILEEYKEGKIGLSDFVDKINDFFFDDCIDLDLSIPQNATIFELADELGFMDLNIEKDPKRVEYYLDKAYHFVGLKETTPVSKRHKKRG